MNVIDIGALKLVYCRKKAREQNVIKIFRNHKRRRRTVEWSEDIT